MFPPPCLICVYDNRNYKLYYRLCGSVFPIPIDINYKRGV